MREAYGLSKNIVLSPMGKYWRVNINQRPAYFLKRLTSDSVHARHVWRSLKFLAMKGVSPRPTWVETVHGEPFIEWEKTQWVLVTWLSGKPAPVYTHEGFPRLLRLLSQVHHLGTDCPHGEFFVPMIAFGKRVSDLESTEFSQESVFTRQYQRLLPHYIETAQQATILLKATLPDDILRATVCHGDPSPKNTLCLGDGRWVLIDWDRLVRAPRWWELSQAIRRFQYQHFWKEWSLWDAVHIHIQPALEPWEKRALWGCLLFPQEFWRLGDQYLREKLHRPEAWFSNRLHTLAQLELRKMLTLLDWSRPFHTLPGQR